MSEYINNQTKRQETLKRLIQELHAGKSVDEVKAEFANLLQSVGAGEIADMEQALITEGVPESEVKRLCDVHVAVFRESLDEQPPPEATPGHPVNTFLEENKAVAKVLDALKDALERFKGSPTQDMLNQARAQLAELREYDKHYLRKENMLFPFLEKHDFGGPSSVMWAIHDDIRATWKALDDALDGEHLESIAKRVDTIYAPLDKMIRDMIYKEENILYPTAQERLSEEEWKAIRAQEDEIGYAYVEPGDQWLPPEGTVACEPEPGEASVEPASAQAVPSLLSLDTGALTPWQVNAMLKALPVDVTFVDEHDTVRYFSQTRERIFTRTPAVIGRKVQQCHPPSSVHRVQQILNEFRAGTRDAAEFWIQMQGMFVHIVYYALRDEQGEYRGTIEVTQDVSHVRQLEGERRLLHEGA